ncbi:MAG: NUDIX domain-containing protein [Spirochaetaceae bacterium]|jgi:8-oxo-dGTP diphosphatase|nr:NUDIX domain-containing protein [Spirochaetaceae bacterium]
MKLRNSVAGLALRGKEFLIARRLPGGDQGEKWEFPGGKVREGESDEDALIREFEEELAAPIRVLSYLGGGEFVHRDTRFTLRAYRVQLLCRSFTLSAHSQWRWASMAELETLDFADSDRLLFPALSRV